MTPFEDLIRELSMTMQVDLRPDSHQACLITFPEDELSIQIDLDHQADKIIVGTQLGRITPGSYREQIFRTAMRVNGTSEALRGILAFSEKNDTLVLFQFLNLATLNGEKLHNFIQLFRQHAKVWKQAISRGDIPTLQEETVGKRESGLFGLRS
jgi:hypothetical protein